jgi:hypothetical protein
MLSDARRRHFARQLTIADHDLLLTKRIVFIGVGSVGSQAAWELACVGEHRYIDGKTLRRENLVRHTVRDRSYVGYNKALALRLWMGKLVPDYVGEDVPRNVDENMTDGQLDSYLADRDLIVISTDDGQVQRRVAGRALALDIPAIVPTLFQGGGEIFVQFSYEAPCYFCLDGWRAANERPRSVDALNAAPLAFIPDIAYLAVGLLDRGCDFAGRTMPDTPGGPPIQLFAHRELIKWQRAVPRRRNCPMCGFVPAGATRTTNPGRQLPAAALVEPPSGSSPLRRPNQSGRESEALVEETLGILDASSGQPGAPPAVDAFRQDIGRWLAMCAVFNLAILAGVLLGHDPEQSAGGPLMGLISIGGPIAWMKAGGHQGWAAVRSGFLIWPVIVVLAVTGAALGHLLAGSGDVAMSSATAEAGSGGGPRLTRETPLRLIVAPYAPARTGAKTIADAPSIVPDLPYHVDLRTQSVGHLRSPGQTQDGGVCPMWAGKWWRLDLRAGDTVSVDWTYSRPASGFYQFLVFDPSTTDGNVAARATNGQQLQFFNRNTSPASASFAVSRTGSYPFIIGDGCPSTSGPLDFVVRVTPG